MINADIEVEVPTTPNRDAILTECAARIAALEGDDSFGRDEMAEIMLNKLAEQASDEIMECARLGKIIRNLNEDLAAEQPKGSYGIGKLVRGAFIQVAEARGARRNDPAVEAATDNLLDKFIGKIYELAGVDR